MVLESTEKTEEELEVGLQQKKVVLASTEKTEEEGIGNHRDT